MYPYCSTSQLLCQTLLYTFTDIPTYLQFFSQQKNANNSPVIFMSNQQVLNASISASPPKNQTKNFRMKWKRRDKKWRFRDETKKWYTTDCSLQYWSKGWDFNFSKNRRFAENRKNPIKSVFFVTDKTAFTIGQFWWNGTNLEVINGDTGHRSKLTVHYYSEVTSSQGCAFYDFLQTRLCDNFKNTENPNGIYKIKQ